MKKILTLAAVIAAFNCFADYYQDDYGYDQNYPTSDYYYPGQDDGYYQDNRAGYYNQDSGSYYRNDRNYDRSNRYSDRNNQSANNYRNRSDRDNKNNDFFNTPDDEKIAKKIRDKVSGWFTSYGDVSIFVNNGNVTLRGYVKSESDKADLEKKVRDMDGVRSLNSQLMVRSEDRDAKREYSRDSRDSRDYNRDYNRDSNRDTYRADKTARDFPLDRAATTADQQLNKKIRDKISEGWFTTSYKNIQLNTQNGVVTINGTVEKPKEEQKLTDEIRKIEGVRAVNSNIQVRNQND